MTIITNSHSNSTKMMRNIHNIKRINTKTLIFNAKLNIRCINTRNMTQMEPQVKEVVKITNKYNNRMTNTRSKTIKRNSNIMMNKIIAISKNIQWLNSKRISFKKKMMIWLPWHTSCLAMQIVVDTNTDLCL